MTSRGAPLVQKDQRFGTSVAGYRLEERIGQGGMGVVYRAVAPSGDPVALKLMLDELALDPLFRERFIREAERVPAIDHPHIVPILDSGEDDGALFIVMELIDGPDLKTLIRERGRLTLHQTKELISQMGSALDAAHEAGLVHRDVKAQNILIGGSPEEPHAYITDFGLMKPIASDTSISRTGQVFGSVPYMPPELIEAMPSDGRADVYALGCVLYECLTGQVPFVRANEVAMLWAHIHEDPPRPSALCPELPGGVDDVVVRALQKHPDDRYLTCGELYEDLVAGLRRRKSLTQGSRTRMLVARVRRSVGPREVWAPNFFPELARVESARRAIDWRKAALVAFTFTFPLASIIHVTSPNGLPTALADAASAGRSFVGDVFNSDSKDNEEQKQEQIRLAQRTKKAAPQPPQAAGAPVGRDRTSSSKTKDVVSVAPDVPASDQVLGSSFTGGDGRIVFTRLDGGNTEIFSIRPDGSGLQRLTDEPAGDSTPSISPNGRWIAFWSNRGDSDGDIFLMRTDGSRVSRITDDPSYDAYPAWSPDGRWITYTSYPAPGCSTPGCVQGSELGEGDIRAVRLRDGKVRTLVSLRDNMFPHWSSDGSRIVFVRDGDIYTTALDGSGFHRLTNTPGPERQPRWSPNGKSIAYAHLGAIHVLDVASGSSAPVTNLGQGADSPAWSPNGSRLVYSICVSPSNCTQRHLWVVGADGSAPMRISGGNGNDYFADWGRWR